MTEGVVDLTIWNTEEISDYQIHHVAELQDGNIANFKNEMIEHIKAEVGRGVFHCICSVRVVMGVYATFNLITFEER